jgi:hypothetical protein
MNDPAIVAVMAAILSADHAQALSPSDMQRILQHNVDTAWDLFLIAQNREAAAHKRTKVDSFVARA